MSYKSLNDFLEERAKEQLGLCRQDALFLATIKIQKEEIARLSRYYSILIDLAGDAVEKRPVIAKARRILKEMGLL